jgi:hypothetical protein
MRWLRWPTRSRPLRAAAPRPIICPEAGPVDALVKRNHNQSFELSQLGRPAVKFDLCACVEVDDDAEARFCAYGEHTGVIGNEAVGETNWPPRV